MDERSSQCEFVRNPEIVLAGNARKQYSGIQSCTNGLAQALMFFTTILQSRSPCFPVSLRFCVPVAWALLQYRLPPSRWVQPMQQTRRTVALKNPFLAENDQAMTRMMDGMSIRPSGDVDRDFTALMIPHHQGAIDMAQAELRYGHNEQSRRIPQEIIVEQQQEITAMRLALGQPLPPSAAAPDQGQAPAHTTPSQPASSTTMSMPMRMNQEME